MPPRKSNPLSDAERQALSRDRAAAAGLSRKEFLLPDATMQDEEFIRRREGPERIRTLIGWVFAKERKRLEEDGS